MTQEYKQAFNRAQADLNHAIQQRDKWTMEVAKLQQLVKSLGAISGSQDTDFSAMEESLSTPEIGLQEVVFTCIRMSPKPLTAVDVRNQLKLVGYDISGYANPLAVIHGAINRLQKSGKIMPERDGAYVVNVRGALTKTVKEYTKK